MEKEILEEVFNTTFSRIKSALKKQYEIERRGSYSSGRLSKDFESIYSAFDPEDRAFLRWSVSSEINQHKKLSTLESYFGEVNVDAFNPFEFDFVDARSTKKINIRQYYPEEEFSKFYKLLFIIACLFAFADSPDEWSMDDEWKQIPHLSLEMRVLLEYIVMIDEEHQGKNAGKMKDQLKHLSKSLLKKTCNCCIEKGQTMKYVREYFLLSVQFHCFLQRYIDNTLTKEKAFQKTAALVSLETIEYYYDKTDFENAIKYAYWALASDDSLTIKSAYNLLGLCAIDSKQYQLSYDIFFSWITSSMISNLERDLRLSKGVFDNLEDLLKSQKEKVWRENNKNEVASMYGNFAYVCGEMYDLLRPSILRNELISLAVFYAEKAAILNPESIVHDSNAGAFFSDANENQKAIEFYKKHLNKSYYLHEKVNVLRKILREYRDILNESNYKDFDYISEEYIKYYSLLMRKPRNEEMLRFFLISGDDKDCADALTYGRNFFFLLTKSNQLSEPCKEVKYSLFKIDRAAKIILNRLRRPSFSSFDFDLHSELLADDERSRVLHNFIHVSPTEEAKEKRVKKEIAYYTTFENLKYLFEEINPETGKTRFETEMTNSEANNKIEKSNTTDCAEGIKKADNDIAPQVQEKSTEITSANSNQYINAFTMMHARYMNDPEEGLVLFRNLSETLPMDPENLRDMLYDQKHVFLKSFTGLIDQLNMWTLYGSDISKGKDCNGCCVSFAPETFEAASDLNNKSTAKISAHCDDDYDLYDVAYINEKSIFVDGARSAILEAKFNELKKLLRDLKKALKKATPNDIVIVAECLVRILEKPMFLFKDYSYHQEAESRIIISRDIVDRKEIRQTKQFPPKLFINPAFQVYPERIIIGPKVENADYWIPHLQYELSKFHDKWNSASRDYSPVVRVSHISIR